MAKILLGSSIGDMRGKQGGTVYSRNRYGNYTRNKTIPVNPNTVKQSAVRNNLGAISSGWRSLTEADRNAWGALATGLAPTNIFGQTFNYTPFNVYMKGNQSLISAGLPTLTSPDVVPPTFAELTFAVAISAFANTFELSFGFNGLAITPPDYRVIVQATPPVNGSIGSSTASRLYRAMATSNAAQDFTTPWDVTNTYDTLFGSVGLVSGNFVWLRACIIHETTGITSPWLVNQAEVI